MMAPYIFYAPNPRVSAAAVERAFHARGIAAMCHPAEYGAVLVTAKWRGPYLFLPMFRSPTVVYLN
jgi:hypothetical protein